MDTNNDHAVKVLNGLIETTLDSANGYKEAAENVESQEYRAMFNERAAKRMDLTRRLQQEVRSFGGEPEDDQSIMGKLHNKFVDLKTALTGGPNDKGVINEVERGEDVIKAKYEHACRDEELPSTVKGLVTEAYSSVKADHDEISRIKHALN
ncbi:PA2169 family four-helix-bundle protein [Caulobacter sp. SLTY]|uniref:PA2169 family four-helix-bundle protein n=1 Tax=Caulobacter sp. SLTY TaxID=2683262 RepID=UPI001411C926|nr:PA2169 family four-helix-bundle protein [Caulobacter sp. SLTY]NBB15071.1 PA2169 family four-helix-bundle protein [Caulobacter sp. SLTY]